MSSDQQYPYDPERGHAAQPPPPHRQHGAPPQPQGPAYGSYEPEVGVPGAPSDMEATQTWQGQTWDTASQPAVDWPAAGPSQQGPSYEPAPSAQPRHAARQPMGEGPQAPSYQQAGPPRPQYPYPPQPQQAGPSRQPQQHLPYGTPGTAEQPQTPSAAGYPAGTPHPPQGPHRGAAPYAPEAGQALSQDPRPAGSMEETAYLPAPGPMDGGRPAQPSGAYPLPPEVPVAGQAAQAAHVPAAAPTEVLPPVPAHAGPGGPVPPGPAPAGPAHAAPGSGRSAAPVPPSAAAGSAAAGYSAPTTVGNARITDAQRARAEGRSPIIPPGIQPAALTAVLGLLLAGGAALGSYALLVPVVVLQAVTAAGWFRLNGMWPARQGIALAFLGGLVADVALLAAGRDNGPAAIIGTLGVWVLLTVILQLRSHADPDTRLSGLFATVVSAALAIIATGYLAPSSDAVVVGAVAVAVTTVVRALPLPGPASVVASLVVAAGAGLVMGGVTDFGTKGVVLGLGAGVCALVGLRAASYDYPSRFVHMTAGVALPLTAAAPVVWLLGRALG